MMRWLILFTCISAAFAGETVVLIDDAGFVYRVDAEDPEITLEDKTVIARIATGTGEGDDTVDGDNDGDPGRYEIEKQRSRLVVRDANGKRVAEIEEGVGDRLIIRDMDRKRIGVIEGEARN